MRCGLKVNNYILHVHQCRLIVTVISPASAGATISFRIESVEQVLDTFSSGFSIQILEFNSPFFTCNSLPELLRATLSSLSAKSQDLHALETLSIAPGELPFVKVKSTNAAVGKPTCSQHQE